MTNRWRSRWSWEVSDIDYLTQEEFAELGFEAVEGFAALVKRAELAINLFIGNFYDQVDFETDFIPRKAAIKQAVAFQVAYLDSSGIMTAEDKQSIGSVTVGRTSVSYREGQRHNLSADTLNCLRGAGFGYSRVSYDR